MSKSTELGPGQAGKAYEGGGVDNTCSIRLRIESIHVVAVFELRFIQVKNIIHKSHRKDEIRDCGSLNVVHSVHTLRDAHVEVATVRDVRFETEIQ